MGAKPNARRFGFGKPQKSQTTMKFAIEIGEVEKHVLEYERNDVTGYWQIRIDGQEVKQNKQILFNPRKQVHEFDVGNLERLSVRIEIERSLWGREMKRVFVNGRLAKLFKDKTSEGVSTLSINGQSPDTLN